MRPGSTVASPRSMIFASGGKEAVISAAGPMLLTLSPSMITAAVVPDDAGHGIDEVRRFDDHQRRRFGCVFGQQGGDGQQTGEDQERSAFHKEGGHGSARSDNNVRRKAMTISGRAGAFFTTVERPTD